MNIVTGVLAVSAVAVGLVLVAAEKPANYPVAKRQGKWAE